MVVLSGLENQAKMIKKIVEIMLKLSILKGLKIKYNLLKWG
jgi:hypothetical protein